MEIIVHKFLKLGNHSLTVGNNIIINYRGIARAAIFQLYSGDEHKMDDKIDGAQG